MGRAHNLWRRMSEKQAHFNEEAEDCCGAGSLQRRDSLSTFQTINEKVCGTLQCVCPSSSLWGGDCPLSWGATVLVNAGCMFCACVSCPCVCICARLCVCVCVRVCVVLRGQWSSNNESQAPHHTISCLCACVCMCECVYIYTRICMYVWVCS